MALSAGMPMELVQHVTGHKTVAVVLKHYFKPGREQFRAAMMKAMPGMMTVGQITPQEEMRQIVMGLTAENLRKGKARLTEILDKGI
jgi:hypothetical protein